MLQLDDFTSCAGRQKLVEWLQVFRSGHINNTSTLIAQNGWEANIKVETDQKAEKAVANVTPFADFQLCCQPDVCS